MSVKPLAPLVESLLEELRTGNKEKRSALQSSWARIVGSVFAQHTQATLSPGGTLCVRVDDSVLAYELSQRYRGTILKRVTGALGEGVVKKVVVRVGQIR